MVVGRLGKVGRHVHRHVVEVSGGGQDIALVLLEAVLVWPAKKIPVTTLRVQKVCHLLIRTSDVLLELKVLPFLFFFSFINPLSAT